MTIVREPEQSVVTPTVTRFFLRVRFWVVVAVIVLVVAALSSLTNGASLDTAPLAADGTGTVGSKALVEVLRQQGVSVVPVDTLEAAADAVTTSGDTTILLSDDADYLSAEQLRRVAGLAAHLVVVRPSLDELDTLAPSVHLAGKSHDTMTADCPVTAVKKAGTVTDGGIGYRVDASGPDAARCLGSGSGVFSLVQLASTAGDLTILGTENALTNQHIIERGNAALALNLLGSTHRLVWYLPSIEDAATTAPPSIASATPQWVIPLAGLAFLVVIAAAVWRGRRFGPLVVERLPVTVRASETLEGRARLYQKSSARLRALDSLRIGTLERLGKTCGLPRTATADDVVVAVASATGRPVADTRMLLLDSVPRNDSELVRLSDELLLLERATTSATRPA